MVKKQFYGIKYPFTSENSENYFIDLNNNVNEKVKSQLMHLIFTPKGQKIRDPEFGTDLIKFIFEPNDSISIESIKSEVNEAVHRYIKDINIDDISILKSENDFSEIYVKLSYTISNGIENKNEKIIIKM